MIETLILSSLISDDKYIRKVIPYIKREYFREMGEKVIFGFIKDHFSKYNKPPSKQIIQAELSEKNIQENIFEQVIETLDNLNPDETVDTEWLVDATEEFCKKRAFYNAILSATDLIEKDDTTMYNSMLDTMQDALSVSFDNYIGHDFLEDAEERFRRYKEHDEQIPCGLDIFNKATKGGFVVPSLTVFMAPTGVGKSIFLCNFASDFLELGKNVLFITLEMSEIQVSKRIELDLLDLETEQLKHLELTGYLNRIKRIKTKTNGKLIIKEYPSGQAHSSHFRHAIDELKSKKRMEPDVIIVDYLNICASATKTRTHNTYEYNQAIARELRSLSQEFNCPVFTATQVNREGAKSDDFGITDTSDSWGVPAESDYFYGIYEPEELAKLGQFKIRRLKDRYNDYKEWMPAFMIGIDKKKQRLYDLEHDTENHDNSVSTEFEKTALADEILG